MRPVVTLCFRAGAALVAGVVLPFVASGPVAAAQTQSQTQGTDVAKWITFTSRAGWSIKRPPELNISSCRQCSDPTDPDVIVAFSKPSGEVVAMIEPLAEKNAAQSPRQWLSGVARDTILIPKLSEEWTTIDGAPALVVFNGTSNSDKAENVYILHGAKTFAVRFPHIQNVAIRAVCERMLSTMRLPAERVN